MAEVVEYGCKSEAEMLLNLRTSTVLAQQAVRYCKGSLGQSCTTLYGAVWCVWSFVELQSSSASGSPAAQVCFTDAAQRDTLLGGREIAHVAIPGWFQLRVRFPFPPHKGQIDSIQDNTTELHTLKMASSFLPLQV